MKKAVLPIILVCILVLGAGLLIHIKRSQIQQLREQYETEVSELREQYETEVARLEKQMERQEQEELTKHRQRMADQALVSGRRARERHEEEWNRRSNYDPAYAKTPREKAILEMVSLSKKESLPSKELLKRIAILAAPKRSNVDVTTSPGGYRVIVTFDMSVMTFGEQGSNTKHTSIKSLKREVVEIISRVMKDMYDHCNRKGIDRISVACTHGVKLSQFGYTSGGATVTKTIYRCAITATDASNISDWRRVPLYKVTDMFNVEHNEFPRLQILTTTVSGFGW